MAAVLAETLIPQVKQWVYTTPSFQKGKGGHTFINKNASGIDSVRFQTTEVETNADGSFALRCVAPFGISEPYDEKSDANRRNMELSIKDHRLLEFGRVFDNENKQRAKDNVQDWFASAKVKPTESDIDRMYKPCVTESADYDPTLRIKVDLEGAKAVNVYLMKKSDAGEWEYTEGSWKDVRKFDEVVALVNIVGLWFTKTAFGPSLLCTDLMVFQRATKPKMDFKVAGLTLKRTSRDAFGSSEEPAIDVRYEALAARRDTGGFADPDDVPDGPPGMNDTMAIDTD